MITLIVLICSILGSVVATTKHRPLDNVTYSYGIFAPLGLTVGGYVGFIAALGLVLGALVLLIFNKGWRAGTFSDGIFFNRRSLDFQRAFGEMGTFDDLSQRHENSSSHRLFWEDRINAVAAMFKQ